MERRATMKGAMKLVKPGRQPTSSEAELPRDYNVRAGKIGRRDAERSSAHEKVERGQGEEHASTHHTASHGTRDKLLLSQEPPSKVRRRLPNADNRTNVGDI